jgi:hypothetical protein
MNIITLKKIGPNDKLSTVIDKTNYNFAQIQQNGGGPKGDKGDDGVGLIGATGLGMQGIQGEQGSLIWYAGVPIVDGSPVTDPLHRLQDTIIDLNAKYFEVTGIPGGLIYTQRLDLGALSATDYVKLQGLYAQQVKHLLYDYTSPPAMDLTQKYSSAVLVDEQAGASGYYRFLIGMDTYAPMFAMAKNSSMTLCNIMSEDLLTAGGLDANTQVLDWAQLTLKYRPYSDAVPSAHSVIHKFTEDTAGTTMGYTANMEGVEIEMVKNPSGGIMAFKVPNSMGISAMIFSTGPDIWAMTDYYNVSIVDGIGAYVWASGSLTMMYGQEVAGNFMLTDGVASIQIVTGDVIVEVDGDMVIEMLNGGGDMLRLIGAPAAGGSFMINLEDHLAIFGDSPTSSLSVYVGLTSGHSTFLNGQVFLSVLSTGSEIAVTYDAGLGLYVLDLESGGFGGDTNSNILYIKQGIGALNLVEKVIMNQQRYVTLYFTQTIHFKHTAGVLETPTGLDYDFVAGESCNLFADSLTTKVMIMSMRPRTLNMPRGVGTCDWFFDGFEYILELSGNGDTYYIESPGGKINDIKINGTTAPIGTVVTVSIKLMSVGIFGDYFDLSSGHFARDGSQTKLYISGSANSIHVYTFRMVANQYGGRVWAIFKHTSDEEWTFFSHTYNLVANPSHILMQTAGAGTITLNSQLIRYRHRQNSYLFCFDLDLSWAVLGATDYVLIGLPYRGTVGSGSTGLAISEFAMGSAWLTFYGDPGVPPPALVPVYPYPANPRYIKIGADLSSWTDAKIQGKVELIMY